MNIHKTIGLFLTICLSLFTTQAQETAKIYQQYVDDPSTSPLIDFSMAGYGFGDKPYQYPTKRINVQDRGILPDTGEDLTDQVNQLLNEVGQQGGGIVFFPAGKYIFNTNPTKLDFIRIDYDNIIIRGEGQDEDGTVFYNSTTLVNNSSNPWLSPALIHVGSKLESYNRFWGVAPLHPQYGNTYEITKTKKSKSDDAITELPMNIRVTRDAAKGSKTLKVMTTKGIQAGDVIMIAEYNTEGKCDLIKELLNYTDKEFTDELINAKRAGKEGIASYQVLVEVSQVISKDQLLLRQPLKRAIKLAYAPRIAPVVMLRNIGVEHLRIENAWDGKYKHHLNTEVDYGWNGIDYTRVAHGWIKNVTIDNSTNPIYLVDSRNVTIDSIHTTGKMGHCGIKLYSHSNDNLIKHVVMDADYTHGLSMEGNCYGNVFSRCKLNNQDYGPGFFDFHGFSHYTYSPPAQNLFELCDGLNTISGGGAPQNFPHTGVGNVWWNDHSILYGSTDKEGRKEVFHHYIWDQENKPHRTDHHISYPQSILVGFSAEDGHLVVNKSDKDRNDRLIITEQLNSSVLPHSLYEAQKRNRAGYTNPIIPGFHPDPSICRKDSDYYLVTSSFEYFPGVPIFHSRDLVNWEQIGHCLTRPSQVNLDKCRVSGGIYAPTIRYHDGTFYMIVTNVTDKGNFIVYTDDPAGEWSDPVWLTQGGIDPSLYWEGDKCYLVSNPHGLCLSEINPKTGEQLTPTRCIWNGTGDRFAEAPHIYKKDGYYYLLDAEGGTQYGHKVMIARSKEIYGPYTGNPANPILTHAYESTKRNSIQGTGHGDLIKAHDGSWWMVHLGFRPGPYRHHVMGRETCLAPVEWPKGSWPIVNGTGTIDEHMIAKTLPLKPFQKDNNPSTDFNEKELGFAWNYLRNPDMKHYTLEENPGYLRLKASSIALTEIDSPTFVGTRQDHMFETVSTKAEISKRSKGFRGGLTVFQNATNHYTLELIHKNGATYVQVGVRLGLLHYIAKEQRISSNSAILKVVTTKDAYQFYCNEKHLIDLDTRYLSSETAGGFTGVYFALFAYAPNNNGAIDFDYYHVDY